LEAEWMTLCSSGFARPKLVENSHLQAQADFVEPLFILAEGAWPIIASFQGIKRVVRRLEIVTKLEKLASPGPKDRE
jgi:hypothetical protein